MKLLFVFVLFGLSSFSILNGQEIVNETKPGRKIKITDVFVQSGFFTEKGGTGTLSDFQTLAPNSVLLNNDFSGYTVGNGFTINTTSMFSFQLGIKFLDKEKSNYNLNPLLKIGINYFSPSGLGSYYFKDEIIRGDTLTSSSGHVIYVDTFTTKNYWMSYSSDQIRLDASLLFRTNEDSRWSFYTGMGFTAGFSLNSKTYISQGENTRTNFYNTNTNADYSENLSFQGGGSEMFKNKSNFGASIFLPIGFDFRIGKNNEFWKHIHLYYDLRPGLNITSIPELGTFANGSIQHGLGFRYSW